MYHEYFFFFKDCTSFEYLPYIRIFSRATKFAKMGKFCNIFNLFHIENDTGYNFCVFNYLRFKRGREKSKD